MTDRFDLTKIPFFDSVDASHPNFKQISGLIVSCAGKQDCWQGQLNAYADHQTITQKEEKETTKAAVNLLGLSKY